MLKATDTKFAPWHVVRSDDKRRARLNCILHPPSAEHSCDRQARSARPRKAGTFAASPCALTAPGTALATVQAQFPNPAVCSSWSALQKPTPHESQKNRFGNPASLK